MSVLAGIYALRILGLFLVMPVFALYAADLPGATPEMIGLALGGAYGLTQALFQVPFGLASDRYGRKPVIVLGLLIFAAGSVMAAVATDIHWVIAGRAVQGAGAVNAATMALLADLTRTQVRTTAMTFIGMTIGASFLLSIVVGPVLGGLVGVPGIFWLTAGLVLAAMMLLVLCVPEPEFESGAAPALADSAPAGLATLVRNSVLARLNSGIFALHFAMTALFVVLPGEIVARAGLVAAQHWKLYLPVLLAAILTMWPLQRIARQPVRERSVLQGGVVVMALAQVVLWRVPGAVGLAVALWLHFSATTLLEGLLPSLVSRVAPAEARGAAIGLYSTSMFLGIAAGGAFGGLVAGRWGSQAVFLMSLGVLTLWAIMTRGWVLPSARN